MKKQLVCPNCNNDIFYKDISIATAMAKCGECHTVFSFDMEKENHGTDNYLRPPRKEEIFVIPKGIEILKIFGELNIEMKWRQTSSWFMMLFTLIWNAILLPFVLVAIISGEYSILLFCSLHLAVGLGLIYWLLCNLLNTTYITVDEHFLKIEVRPLNLFYKTKEIPVGDIEQLYVNKYSNGKTNGRPNYVYRLMLVLKNKEEIKPIQGLGKAIQGQYIEQEIERFAKIQDKFIHGEF
ncbi:MAG: hypothetical protein ACPG5P_06555 [Saprospiraceae bacterium]